MTRLRACLVTPLRGPLALFGRAGASGLDVWARSAAHLLAPWDGVELTVRDSAGDTAAAMRAALQEQPDVLFGPYGSGPTLAAARTTQRVIWNHGGATSQLSLPAFPHVINVLAPASSYFASTLQAIQTFDATVHTVSLLYSTSSFGRDVASGALATATELHLEIQARPFAPSHALDAAIALPQADILLVAGNFADERAVAPTLLARPWRFAAFVGAGVEEVLTSLGDLREGLLGPAQWFARTAHQPDEGPDAAWFVKRYRALTGNEPAYPATQAFAAGLICARCLREAGSCDDKAQIAAARQLTCTTLYGPFQLDSATGLQAGHRVLVVQWQQGQRRVVWPPAQAEYHIIAPFAI